MKGEGEIPHFTPLCPGFQRGPRGGCAHSPAGRDPPRYSPPPPTAGAPGRSLAEESPSLTDNSGLCESRWDTVRITPALQRPFSGSSSPPTPTHRNRFPTSSGRDSTTTAMAVAPTHRPAERASSPAAELAALYGSPMPREARRRGAEAATEGATPVSAQLSGRLAREVCLPSPAAPSRAPRAAAAAAAATSLTQTHGREGRARGRGSRSLAPSERSVLQPRPLRPHKPTAMETGTTRHLPPPDTNALVGRWGGKERGVGRGGGATQRGKESVHGGARRLAPGGAGGCQQTTK